MDPWKLFAVALGGVLGALLRYTISTKLSTWNNIPLGTLFVNSIGSFLLGILITLYQKEIINDNIFALLGIGFMGSFTTMSSFSVDTVLLSEISFYDALRNFIYMMVSVFIGVILGRQLTIYALSG